MVSLAHETSAGVGMLCGTTTLICSPFRLLTSRPLFCTLVFIRAQRPRLPESPL